MKTTYDALLGRLCAHLGLPDVQRLQATGALQVADRSVLLSFDAVIEPATLQIRIDLGPVPAERQEEVWHRLLVTNFDWSAGGTLGWGMTPDQNHVVLTAQYGFDEETSGEELAQRLRDLAAVAMSHWQFTLSSETLLEAELPPSNLFVQRQVAAPHRIPDWYDLTSALRAYCDSYETDIQIHDDGMMVHGVQMAFNYDLQMPDRFELRVNIGLDTTLNREGLWKGLLWNNFISGLTGRIAFSLLPDSDHVVLAWQHDIPADGTAEGLAELLKTVAERSKNFWTPAAISQELPLLTEAAAIASF